jgi:hypothetical protein
MPRSPVSSSLVAGAALVLSLAFFCGSTTPALAGDDCPFLIIASGDTILTGSDVERFDCSTGELYLSPAGIERWGRWARANRDSIRTVPQLSKLGGLEFQLELGDSTVATGHFSSRVSSMLQDGLVIYDALILPGDDTLQFVWDGGRREDQGESDRDRDTLMHQIHECMKASGKLSGTCETNEQN